MGREEEGGELVRGGEEDEERRDASEKFETSSPSGRTEDDKIKTSSPVLTS